MSYDRFVNNWWYFSLHIVLIAVSLGLILTRHFIGLPLLFGGFGWHLYSMYQLSEEEHQERLREIRRGHW